MVQKASRVTAIYDIHGNLPALEAVLAELESVKPDLIVVGGDVVAGPMPDEVLDHLVALGERICFVRGNADREVVTAYDDRPHADPIDVADPAERLSKRKSESSLILWGRRGTQTATTTSVTEVIEVTGYQLWCGVLRKANVAPTAASSSWHS